MEAFRSIPKMLQGIQGIHSNINQADHLTEYKKNVKIFIKSITSEVSEMIDQYERKIALLQQQNKRLKEHKNHFESIIHENKGRNDYSNHETKVIPLSKITPNIDKMDVAQSHLFNNSSHEIEEDIKFSTVLPRHKTGKKEDNNFPVQLINQEQDEEFQQGKSHFQVRNNRRKHHEAQLRQFLETGNKSMNITTQKYLACIGKNKKQEEKTSQLQLNRDQSDSSISIKRNDEDLNKSLSNICNNLDNSLLGRRSKSNKKDKINQDKNAALMKQKQEEEIAKMMKNIGVKNLLLRLRENVEASAKHEPQIIKCSKLIVCGGPKSPMKEINLAQASRNSSKVLINPVPVDIVKKSKVTKQEKIPSETPFTITPQPILKQSPLSPTKSILKQTSTILTKSFEGLSDIEDLE